MGNPTWYSLHRLYEIGVLCCASVLDPSVNACLNALQIPWGQASALFYAVFSPPVLLTEVSRQCVKSVTWNDASQMAQVKVLGFGKLGVYHSNEINIR